MSATLLNEYGMVWLNFCTLSLCRIDEIIIFIIFI